MRRNACQSALGHGGLGLFGGTISSFGANLPEIYVFVVFAFIAAFYAGITGDETRDAFAIFIKNFIHRYIVGEELSPPNTFRF